MSSMYDTLMNLPLFKGISRDALSLFLEKTHLAFSTYEPGDVVLRPSSKCNSVVSILSGEVEVTHAIFDGELKILETLPAERCLGLERLFGRETHNEGLVRARTHCGVMEFSKAQYISFLQTNQVGLMNYMNAVCMAAQKAQIAFKNLRLGNAVGFMADLVTVSTAREARDIHIISKSRSITEWMHPWFPEAETEFAPLLCSGIIEACSSKEWRIPDRLNFMDVAKGTLEP